jgi:hypothetical protein
MHARSCTLSSLYFIIYLFPSYFRFLFISNAPVNISSLVYNLSFFPSCLFLFYFSFSFFYRLSVSVLEFLIIDVFFVFDFPLIPYLMFFLYLLFHSFYLFFCYLSSFYFF